MSEKVDVQRSKTSPVRSPKDEDLGSDTIAPAVDIYETDTGWVLAADMPGVAKDQLDVQVERGVLTIAGRFSAEAPEGRTVHGGFRRPDYFRSLALSDEIDRGNISAGLNNGVLTVVLPRAEAARTRKITVEGGD